MADLFLFLTDAKRSEAFLVGGEEVDDLLRFVFVEDVGVGPNGSDEVAPMCCGEVFEESENDEIL